MPTKIEKDVVSGQDTTGHEWDGVRELNTPLPKWWVYVYLASIAYAIGQFIIYPSVPWISGYFHGTAGYSQRAAVEQDVAAVKAQRAVYMDRIASMPMESVRDDAQLYAVALTAGRIAFADNCQPCHGPGGQGRPGYPVLADDVWLWGGRLDDIRRTITFGVRADNAESRASTMPAFGASLSTEELEAVTDHVMALYGGPENPATGALGRKLFGEVCAPCHGDRGQGNREQGGPPLASRVHLYGADRASVRRQISAPRMGVMPAWSARLDPATIKALALYVHQMGGGE